jgi:hypothetical protein
MTRHNQTKELTTWFLSLDLGNLTLRSETLCQMFSSWWDFEGVCTSCAKSALFCLVFKLAQILVLFCA